MAHIKFTDATIRNLGLPEKGRVTYWAEGISGLGLRCGAKAKTFIGKLDFMGRDTTITYGQYPAVTVSAAIMKHMAKVKMAEMGVDPSDAVKGDKSIREWGVEYFVDRKKNGYKDVSNQKNIFLKDVVPVIGKLLPRDVTVPQLRKLIDKTLTRIQKEKPDQEGAGLSHIRHLQVVLRGFFKWLNMRGELDSNPAAGMETVGVARVRERVLSPVEIWRFWNRIDGGGLEAHTAGALRMMLATGQRGKEVRSLKWSDLTEGGNIWVLSAVDTKNKKMHRIPLGIMAKEVIAGARPPKYKRPDADIYVFGAAAQLSERALSKALLRERSRMDIGDVTPHDLRRTAATLVTAMGLPSFYASLLLNHAQQGVTNRVYVQYSFDAEKKRAVDVLDKALESIVSAKSERAVPTIDGLRQAAAELSS